MKALNPVHLLSAALVVLATAPAAVSAREQVKDVQVFDTGSKPRLSLKNINGDLTVEGWDKNRIEVSIVKTASSTDRMDDIDVNVSMENDHLRIEVELDDEHFGSHRGESARVDFTVHVPRGTRIDAVEMVNGDAAINGVSGDVEVSSVNGQVSGEKLGGHVELATVNGEVMLVAGDGVDSIRMNSVNGGVTLVLPKKFDASIHAGTLHGDIVAMDGLDVDATSFTGSSMKGTLGKGGLKVDLNTVNGSIEIRHEGEGGARDRE